MSDKPLDQILAEISKRVESATEEYPFTPPEFSFGGNVQIADIKDVVKFKNEQLKLTEQLIRSDVPALIKALKLAIQQRDCYAKGVRDWDEEYLENVELAALLKGKV